ncbi:hypothetical protein ACOZ38_28285 [Sphaerisporangium viridialbum]|uniref:hypothetical protein n=1 Tax=Sphaerisporangium viridialbum TaxID=46189 RepID=UPI003C7479BC
MTEMSSETRRILREAIAEAHLSDHRDLDTGPLARLSDQLSRPTSGGTVFRQGSKSRNHKCSPADGYQPPSLPQGDSLTLMRNRMLTSTLNLQRTATPPGIPCCPTSPRHAATKDHPPPPAPLTAPREPLADIDFAFQAHGGEVAGA